MGDAFYLFYVFFYLAQFYSEAAYFDLVVFSSVIKELPFLIPAHKVTCSIEGVCGGKGRWFEGSGRKLWRMEVALCYLHSSYVKFSHGTRRHELHVVSQYIKVCVVYGSPYGDEPVLRMWLTGVPSHIYSRLSGAIEVNETGFCVLGQCVEVVDTGRGQGFTAGKYVTEAIDF